MNIKPGIQSSEFWLGLASVILTYLNTNLGWNVPVPAIIACLGVVASYILGRSYLKSKSV